MDQRSLSVVIPVFNEAEIIREVIEEALGVLRGRSIEYEVIAVNDGSSDGTRAVLDEMAGQVPALKVKHHGQNQGMGAALRTGLDEARMDLVTWIPGDGQFDLNEVLKGLAKLEEADMVIALRTGVRTSWRAAITMCFHLMIRLMFRFDAAEMCGIFLLKREILKQSMPEANNVFFTIELPVRVRRRGYRIEQYEVPLRPRLGGVSKVANLRTYISNIVEMTGIWWRTRS